MKILVVGSGGREHALAWKLASSDRVAEVIAAPGNGGTAAEPGVRNAPVNADDISKLLKLAQSEKIDLTVVGPEVPLAAGIVDAFKKENLKIFGPDKAGARIEASKAFSKEVMERSGVPTAAWKRFVLPEDARAYVKERGAPIVIKADGLAAGKGVTVAATVDEALSAIDDILVKKIFGESGTSLVVEDFLDGEELSYMVVTDGTSVLPLVTSQDHKAAYDGDTGPNTGGMGAYSPGPDLGGGDLTALVATPVVKTLGSFCGVLYAGLMAGSAGIKVLEYNCRFGDPETEVVLPRLKSDLTDILLAVCEGRLGEVKADWSDGPAVCVVMASGGYPGAYTTGFPISGIEQANALEGVKVFHSGTVYEDGVFKTAGGRVLTVTATGEDFIAARDRVYEAVKLISFKDMRYRTDIGHKMLKRIK